MRDWDEVYDSQVDAGANPGETASLIDAALVRHRYVNVRLDEDEYKFLKALARREGRSVSGQLRWLVLKERAVPGVR